MSRPRGGLPVVMGEVLDRLDTTAGALAQVDWRDFPGDPANLTSYHYYPSQEQVRAWLDLAGLAVEQEGEGDGYWHLLVRK